jgi:hypothetical protein
MNKVSVTETHGGKSLWGQEFLSQALSLMPRMTEPSDVARVFNL